MKKQIKKISNTSLGIVITKEDRDLYNLKEGDLVYVNFEKDIDWDVIAKRVQDQDQLNSEVNEDEEEKV